MGDKIDIDQLVRLLETLTENFRGASEATEEVTSTLEKQAELNAGYVRQEDGTLKKIKTQAEKRIEIEENLNKEIEAQFGKERVLSDKRDLLYKSQLKSMGYSIDANNQLIKTTVELNDSQQKSINSLKKLAENEEQRLKSKDNVIPELKKGLLEVGKASWGVATNLAKGETSFTTLFPLMDAMANAVGSVGKNLLGMIPIIGQFAGSLFEASTKMALEASKFLIQMLQTSLKNFQEMGDAGALISGGMTSLNDQLVKAGMTVDGFKKVVKENASTLASWGGTVGEGARKFSEAVGELTLTEAGDSLRRLGLTADNIGESAAGFLEQEIRLGRGRNMTQKQLTDGTIQYVKELDLLAKVTGLSRQDAQKQRDELMSDGRYRASIEGMNKENQNALNSLMMRFKDPTLKRGLMDLASGAITTADAGKVVTAFGDTAADAIQSLKDASPDEIPKLLDKIMLDFQESAKNNKELFGDAYKYLEPGTMINAATIFDIASGKYVTSMERAKETQDAQIQNTDKLTEDTVEAQKQMEILSKRLNEFANRALPDAAEAVKAFTIAVNKAIDSILKDKNRPAGTTIVTESEADENIKRAKEKEERAKAIGDTEGEKAARAEREAAERAAALAKIARRNRQQPGTGEPVKPNMPADTKPEKSNKTVTPTPVEQDKSENTTPVKPDKKVKPTTVEPNTPADNTPVKPDKKVTPAPVKPTPPVSTTPVKPNTPVKPAPVKPNTSPVITPSTTPAPETNPNKKTADQLIKFGSNTGDKAHFDMLLPNVREAFMKMIEEYGKPVQVTSAYRSYDEQKSLWDNARSTPNPDIRMQENGLPVSKPGLGAHEKQKAIDIAKSDALEFYNTVQRNGSDLINKYGFNYDPIKDAVHFEKARFGGAFDGPESGYPVMLHGPEVAIPEPKFKEIKETAESVSKSSLSSVLPDTTPTNTNTNNNDSTIILKNLHNLMTDKFDQMINIMERTNDIQYRILNNSMV